MKRILATVLVLALWACTLCLAVPVQAEHECWTTGMNCKCDICGKEVHFCTWEYEYDENYHWRACVCGLKEDSEAAHNVSEYGGCYCGYGDCSHPIEYFLWDIDSKRHSGRCQFCWQVIYEGPHNIVDGVCTYCGFDGCKHTHINWGWSKDGHEGECADCGEVLYPFGPHEFDAEGNCVCPEKACVHGTLAEAESVTLHFNEEKHWYICNLCEYLYYEMEPHTFVNGVCTFCGAKPCANGTHAPGKEYPEHICSKCGMTVGCQDKNGNCRCDYCDTEYHGLYRFDITDTEHQEVCIICGHTYPAQAHYDDDGEIGCDVCGYGAPKPNEKVEVAEGTPAVQAKLPVDTLLTETEKTQIAQGVTVEVALTVRNADDLVTAEEQAAVTAVVEQAATETKVALYLDIDLTKTVGDAEAAAITETAEMVTIVIEIPQELRGADRKFSVIRVHEGEATELEDLDQDPNTVTIQTDRFSTYALVYAAQQVQQPDETEATEPGAVPGPTAGADRPDNPEVTENQTETESQNGTGEPTPEKGMEWYWIAGLAVLAVLIVAAAAVLIKKRSAK